MAKDEVLTEEKPQVIGVPDCPETIGALQPLPRDVRLKWKKAFAEALKEAQGQYPDDALAQLTEAYREANKIFRVKEPKDHKDARQIPDWQVMRRQEVPYGDLPDHVKKDVRREFGRESGVYLEVYAIDGRQYFFELPETEPKKPAKQQQPADPGATS